MAASFDAYFADDGIWFTPHPNRTRETLAKRPKKEETFTLDWRPTRSDVSAAGDLGWNTGPYTVTDRSGTRHPPEHGRFFSVWKRQAGGAWKVAIDFGVPSPAAPEGEAWRAARAERWAGEPGSPEVERETLRRREKELGAARAEARAADFLFLGTGVADAGLTWEASAVDVARSGDLGTAWGSWTRGAERGYFVHVWRRDASGAWKLQVEVMRALPPEAKP